MSDKQEELQLLLDQDESNLTRLGKERLSELKEEIQLENIYKENIS
ncbi:hypothetical protein ACOI1C_07915 [Bacillus sp. DJP31]